MEQAVRNVIVTQDVLGMSGKEIKLCSDLIYSISHIKITEFERQLTSSSTNYEYNIDLLLHVRERMETGLRMYLLDL